MSKVYAQTFPIVWSASVAQSAAASSAGSAISHGYARLVGLHIASASADSSSGLRIWQSSNYGTNWDYWTDFVPSASSGSAFSIEIVGNAVKVQFKPHSAAASVRSLWQLRPV